MPSPSWTWRLATHAYDLDEQGHDPSTWKDAVRAASTGSGTLATAYEDGDTLDGITLATGDRILLKDQTAGEENGIYTVNASGAPTRAQDFDTAADVLGGLVYVIAGTVNAGRLFRSTNTTSPTIGTTALTFDELTTSGGGSSPGVINVMDYGAVEDFSTDNSTAFAAAVADMVDGCTLLFPSITGLGYKTSTGMTIAKSGCVVTGTGSEYGTRVHITASNTTLFTVTPSGLDGTRNQTNLIRGLLLTGPGSASSGRGIYANSDVHLEHVGIAGFYEGLHWDSATFYSRAYGCFITNCVRGVVMNGTNNCTLDTCRITGNFGGGGLIGPITDGVVMATALNVGLTNRIVNCSIEYFSGDGVRWNGGAGGELIGTYFETQQSSTGHAHLNLGESNVVEALLIAGNYFQGDGIAGFLAIKGTDTEKITLLNNKFGINSAIGITANGGGNSDWLLMNNKNSPAGTFLLPSSSYTLDPSSPPSTPPSFATPAIVLGTAAATGSSGTVINSDATIVAFDATVPVTQAFGDSAATGSVAKAARRDHVHGMPATPSSGQLLISDTASNPIIFGDVLLNDAGTDFIYGDS